MYRMIPLIAALAVVPPAAGWAQADAGRCERLAREKSGYREGLLPSIRFGPFTARISGSVSIGVSRSTGPATQPTPRGAGAGALEMRRLRAERAYRDAYEACMAGR